MGDYNAKHAISIISEEVSFESTTPCDKSIYGKAVNRTSTHFVEAAVLIFLHRNFSSQNV